MQKAADSSDNISVSCATNQESEPVSNVNSIADRIIWIHRDMFEESPSNMKLQKLCYYAQGFFLGENNGTPLFGEEFRAWALGPVCRELYARFRHHKYLPISDSTIQNQTLDATVDIHLQSIVASYGRFDAAALSNMTHNESPWRDARLGVPDGATSDQIIPKQAMASYFRQVIASAE